MSLTKHIRCRHCGDGFVWEPGQGFDEPCVAPEHDASLIIRDANDDIVAGATDDSWWSRETKGRRVEASGWREAREQAEASARRVVQGVAA